MVIKGMGLIAAVGDNGALGLNNRLPWGGEKIEGDFPQFKRTTMGRALIMGRNTYGSIGKPLPGRLNVIVSKTMEKPVSDLIYVARTLDEAIQVSAAYRADGEFWVGGGGEIYRLTINDAEKMRITHVHRTPLFDVQFPKIDLAIWKGTIIEENQQRTFVDYERRDGR